MPTLIHSESADSTDIGTRGRPASLAVVDDDSGFSGYLRTFLTLRGYEARSYARGEEILAALQHGDAPDVVLLDVAMPGMDGLETLKALKRARPEIQVIMLSGRERAATIVEAVRLGAADYVVKPDDAEGLGEVSLDAAIKQAIERNRLVTEVIDLRRQLHDDKSEAFIGWSSSPAMREVARLIEQVADSDVTVLVRGESGVGKELVARAIHQRSTRRHKPLVKVNCAALPTELLESELFGHERGAFTGAAMTRIGKFEQANLGTIFLDEIGDIKPALQAKLLHVLQDCEFTKLGSNKKINVDVRVVAATNRDLEEMMRRGEFREDLYYRLKVIDAYVPALRERRAEIQQLAEFFMLKYSQRYNRPPRRISDETRRLFLQYDWPGNIRELENMIKRFVILQDEELVCAELRTSRSVSCAGADATSPQACSDLEDEAGSCSLSNAAVENIVGDERPTTSHDTRGHSPEEITAPASTAVPRLADVSRGAARTAERAVMADTLRDVKWNRRKAAALLGVSYKTLLNKIKETGLEQG